MEVAQQKMQHTLPFILQWDETFNVGVDTGTPVDDNDYKVPFKFTGKLNKLTVEPKALMLGEDEKKIFQQKGQRNNAASE